MSHLTRYGTLTGHTYLGPSSMMEYLAFASSSLSHFLPLPLPPSLSFVPLIPCSLLLLCLFLPFEPTITQIFKQEMGELYNQDELTCSDNRTDDRFSRSHARSVCLSVCLSLSLSLSLCLSVSLSVSLSCSFSLSLSDNPQDGRFKHYCSSSQHIANSMRQIYSPVDRKRKSE
jgi:hypothetical protein